MWFHPLVWIAHRKLIAAQEEACDEIALAAGIPADEYAADLLETAKHSQAAFSHGLSMARWSQLGSRIQLILQNKNPETKPLTMKTVAILTLGITATTFGLSSLGCKEAPKTTDQPAASEISVSTTTTALAPGVAKNTEKLNRIIFPRVDFEDTTLEEAIDFIRLRSAELDTIELDPMKKGLNFVIRSPQPANKNGEGTAADSIAPDSPRIDELRLVNVPLGILLKYVCDNTGTTYTVNAFAITISPKDKTD